MFTDEKYTEQAAFYITMETIATTLNIVSCFLISIRVENHMRRLHLHTLRQFFELILTFETDLNIKLTAASI